MDGGGELLRLPPPGGWHVQPILVMLGQLILVKHGLRPPAVYRRFLGEHGLRPPVAYANFFRFRLGFGKLQAHALVGFIEKELACLLEDGFGLLTLHLRGALICRILLLKGSGGFRS